LTTQKKTVTDIVYNDNDNLSTEFKWAFEEPKEQGVSKLKNSYVNDNFLENVELKPLSKNEA